MVLVQNMTSVADKGNWTNRKCKYDKIWRFIDINWYWYQRWLSGYVYSNQWQSYPQWFEVFFNFQLIVWCARLKSSVRKYIMIFHTRVYLVTPTYVYFYDKFSIGASSYIPWWMWFQARSVRNIVYFLVVWYLFDNFLYWRSRYSVICFNLK